MNPLLLVMYCCRCFWCWLSLLSAVLLVQFLCFANSIINKDMPCALFHRDGRHRVHQYRIQMLPCAG